MIEEHVTYAPHILCLLRDPWLVWMHMVSDAAIWGAYFAIPAGLVYCARSRRDLLFRGIFFWFALFIVLCGLTHAGNILDMWIPAYWLTAVIKMGTATVSWMTMMQLLPIIPQVLTLPSLVELEQVRQWMLRPQEDRMAEMLAQLDKITTVVAQLTPPRAP